MNRVFTFAVNMMTRKLYNRIFGYACRYHSNNESAFEHAKNVSPVSLADIELLADEVDILLQGSLIDRPVKSYSSTPFHAAKYSSHITVYYLNDLNNISVKIVNASRQIVCSANVNPVAGGQLYIGISSLPAGEYTLMFSNANGNSVYGDFEI
jgi:hypothetical protein